MKKKIFKIKYILLAVLLVVVVGGGVFVWQKYYKSAEQDIINLVEKKDIQMDKGLLSFENIRFVLRERIGTDNSSNYSYFLGQEGKLVSINSQYGKIESVMVKDGKLYLLAGNNLIWYQHMFDSVIEDKLATYTDELVDFAVRYNKDFVGEPASVLTIERTSDDSQDMQFYLTDVQKGQKEKLIDLKAGYLVNYKIIWIDNDIIYLHFITGDMGVSKEKIYTYNLKNKDLTEKIEFNVTDGIGTKITKITPDGYAYVQEWIGKLKNDGKINLSSDKLWKYNLRDFSKELVYEFNNSSQCSDIYTEPFEMSDNANLILHRIFSVNSESERECSSGVVGSYKIINGQAEKIADTIFTHYPINYLGSNYFIQYDVRNIIGYDSRLDYYITYSDSDNKTKTLFISIPLEKYSIVAWF